MMIASHGARSTPDHAATDGRDLSCLGGRTLSTRKNSMPINSIMFPQNTLNTELCIKRSIKVGKCVSSSELPIHCRALRRRGFAQTYSDCAALYYNSATAQGTAPGMTRQLFHSSRRCCSQRHSTPCVASRPDSQQQSLKHVPQAPQGTNAHRPAYFTAT